MSHTTRLNRLEIGIIEILLLTAGNVASWITESMYIDGVSLGISLMVLFHFLTNRYVYGSIYGPEVDQ